MFKSSLTVSLKLAENVVYVTLFPCILPIFSVLGENGKRISLLSAKNDERNSALSVTTAKEFQRIWQKRQKNFIVVGNNGKRISAHPETTAKNFSVVGKYSKRPSPLLAKTVK